MKTLTRRQLSREPSKLDAIKPGESVVVPDAKGGLLVTRPKKNALSADEMLADLDKLAADCPSMDTLSFLTDEA